MKKSIRVLVVDDSSIMRQMLTHILTSVEGIEVVGAAPDPYVARELLVQLKPDVMTLDIEMPRMDGLTFLEKVMNHMPTPTIILSSLSKKGSEMALRASELGAVQVLTKPAIDLKAGLNQMGLEIVNAVRGAAQTNLVALRMTPRVRTPSGSAAPKLALSHTTHQILAIAASTGGTEALRYLLAQMPPNIPPTVIVQHMPPVFTKTFSESLNKLCAFEVKEAADGDRLYVGRVLIAPGDYHMVLNRSGAQYFVELNKNPPEHSVRPAADPLFRSVAKYAGANAVGVVLTGMGRDGAAGLLDMKKAGARTFAQDEKSSVVYGMPREAVELGAVDVVLPLNRMPQSLVAEFEKRDVAS
jgi:two-component system, chemotaxis family, protein-glutamate methylesterase/glutaminase